MHDSMQQRLQAYYAQAFPAKPRPQVTDLVRLPGGWESELYAFDVAYGPAEDWQREALILRLYPGDQAAAKANHEFHSLRHLHQAGYPVPAVHLLERTATPFGMPFVIMERIAGPLMGSRLSSASGEQQRKLLAHFCALLVQLHRLGWRPFVDAGAHDTTPGPYDYVDRSLRRVREALTRFALQGFLPIVAWLEERREAVPCLQPSLVHGDFHPNNILLREDGTAVVIDWAGLQVSDPRFDLAWTLLLVGTHGSMAWRDAIVQAYTRLVGAPVEQLAWFDTFACLRRLRVVTIALSRGAEQLGLHPDAAARMQQRKDALQQVYALLLERTGLRVAEVERLFTAWP